MIKNAIISFLAEHSYGCIFHDCINGAVRKPQNHFSGDMQNLTVGDKIYLKIDKIVSEHRILFVIGNIAPEYQG